MVAGRIFKSIKKKEDKDGIKNFIVSFDFLCDTIDEATALKEKIERSDL